MIYSHNDIIISSSIYYVYIINGTSLVAGL